MAEELGSKLGFDVSSAISSIQKLKRELDGYNSELAKVAGGTKAFNSEQIKADDILRRLATSSEIAVGHLKQLSVAQGQAATSATKLAAAQAKVAATPFQKAVGINPNAAPALSGDQIGAAAQQKQNERLRATEAQLRAIAGRASATGDAVAAGANKGTVAAKQLELSLRSIVRITAVQFAARIFATFVSDITASIKAARSFEIQLAEILTISKEFQNQGLNAVGESIQRLSAEFGRPVEDVAKGLYQTLSNQIGDAAESVRFLSDSLEFSVAAVTSSADAVDLLSGVLNAYNLTAASTTRISDELFKTIELGRVTGTELANTYGRITTLSAQLGVSTAEVDAAIAELTINGVKASDALTQVSNLFLKLVQPSENTKKAFDDLNVASAEAGIALFGLQGFLQKLANNKSALSDIAELLGGRIRAIRGAATLVSNAERLNQTLIEVEQSAGATKKAFDLIDSTNAQKLTKQLEALRGVLINDIGRSAIAAFVSLTEVVGGAKNAMLALGTAMAGIIATGFVIFIGQAAVALKSLGVVASGTAGAIGLIKVAALSAIPIAAAAAFIALAHVRDSADEAKDSIAKLQEQTDKTIKIRVAEALPDVKNQQEEVTAQTKIVEQGLQTRLAAIRQEQIANITSNHLITADLANSVKSRGDLIKAGVKALESFIDEAKSRTKALGQDVSGIIADVNRSQFERTTGQLGEQGQVVARLQEINRLSSEAGRLSLLGDPDSQKRSVDLIKQAVAQGEKVADSANFSRFGQKALNDLKIKALDIDKNIAKTNAKEVQSASAQLDKNKSLDTQAKAIQDAQTQVATTSARLKNDIENNTNNLIVFDEQFKQSVEGIGVGFDAVRKQLVAIEASAARGEQSGAFEFQGQKRAIAQAKADTATLEGLRDQALKAIAEGDTGTIQKIQDELQRASTELTNRIDSKGIADKLKTAIFGDANVEIRDAIKVLSDQLSSASINLAKVNVAQQEKSDLGNQIQALGQAASANAEILQRLPGFLQGVGTASTEASTGLNSIGTSSPAAIEGLNSLQNRIDSFSTANIVTQASNAVQALGAIGRVGAAPATPPTRYWGGPMGYFASGGRGTDTLPAMLSKGEFVVNARSTSKFFSQLQAINANRVPNFRQTGGDTTNVGDINVSVAGGSTSQLTLDNISKGLERRIRQKRVKFK